MTVKYFYNIDLLPSTGAWVSWSGRSRGTACTCDATPRCPAAEFKAEAVVTPTGDIPSATRTVYNRHGLRLLVTQSGRIGAFSFQASAAAAAPAAATAAAAPARRSLTVPSAQTLLINLSVSLGLMSVAVLVSPLPCARMGCVAPRWHGWRAGDGLCHDGLLPAALHLQAVQGACALAVWCV